MKIYLFSMYVVTSSTKGVICAGDAFVTASLAYRYPLVLSIDESYGEIGIQVSYTGVLDSGDMYSYSSGFNKLEMGKSGLYRIKSWLMKGYVYVIVQDKKLQ